TARGDGGADRIGYAGLRQRSRRISAALAGLGIAEGDLVATLAWNTQAHVEVWFAVMGMGAVCHTLNPRLSDTHLIDMMNKSGASILVAAADLAPQARRIAARSPAITRILSIDGAAADG